ncbi:TPA: hypothetical protein ACFM6M_002138, partial [Neisseria meningitidis]
MTTHEKYGKNRASAYISARSRFIRLKNCFFHNLPLQSLYVSLQFVLLFLVYFWGCTRLADMLPSKYEDNTLQIKEKSTERTAPFFCAG